MALARRSGAFARYLKHLWVGGARQTATQHMPLIDKYTREEECAVPAATHVEVEAAFAAADAAQAAMAATLPHERKKVLLRAADILRRDKDVFAFALTVEVGKTTPEALAEVGRAIDTFTVSAEEAVRIQGTCGRLSISTRNQGYSYKTERFPLGVVSMVTPFNFPLNLAAHKVGPAIAAGCPFVLKPSPQTPLTALMLGSVLEEAGLSELAPGAFSMLPCDDVHAPLFSEHPSISCISFTGSPDIGWAIRGAVGSRPVKVHLELGGNAHVVVDKGADLDLAAKRCAAGAFYQAGQSCIAVQNVFVAREEEAAFTEKLLAHVDAFKRGDPHGADATGVFLIPMISEEAAKKVEASIWASGGTILTGGSRDGSFLEPTVVADPDPDADLVTKEAFGPAMTLRAFDDLDSVVQEINKGPFGLQAGVFTPKIKTARKMFRDLEMGGVVVNDVSATRIDSMPYGGVKGSGVGREGPFHAIREFTEERILVVNEYDLQS